MELMKNNFEEIKKTKNPEIINDFLIEISKDPNIDYLECIDYFINNLDTQIFDKVKINLVFLVGEIGKITTLEERYFKFLIETYYSSDRWIRNEIIQAIGKISTYSDIIDDVIKIVGNAVNDDYSPIKVNALKVILNLKELPLSIRGNIFQALNSKNFELEALCVKILEKFVPDYNQLFNSLNYLQDYKILKQKAIRALLLIYFKSALYLESFRQKISNSKWEIEYKENFFKEIDIYKRILLKKL